MKKLGLSLGVMMLSGCSSLTTPQEPPLADVSQLCQGDVALPQGLAPHFEATQDPELLKSALGEPEQGKLCQGQVYQSKPDAEVVLFRAWNSTNPNSQFGKWWAFHQPNGKIAAYRSDYEICYQWSPLDKLVRCTLKPGTKVVVGNGQSAKCSEYLTYPTSDKQQVYLVDAEAAVLNCTEYDGVMSWQ